MENQTGNAPNPEATPPSEQASWLVRTAVHNPYLVIVGCLFIIVLAYVSLTRVPVDILPVYQSPAVQVLTLYPGMPTDFMDRTITNRIERWTGQAVGIKHQESRTMIGVSVVRDYFAEGTDPNAAFAQVSSLAMSDLYYLPPGTVPPMVMLYDPTAPLPTAYLAASSEVLNETQVYELAYFNVRNMLSGTPGVIAPAVFGGKLRRIYGYLEPDELHARGLSLMDIQKTLKAGSPMIPPGTIRIGDQELLLDMNAMPHHYGELNKIPVKTEFHSADGIGKQIHIKDVGKVEDAAAIQTNIVRITRAPKWEGQQTVIIPIFRRPGSNTIEIVEGVKKSIPAFLDRLPAREGGDDSGLKLDVVADQSVFVRSAINNLLWEGILGASLAALMVLLFIGSVRSTAVIALNIPLACLAAVIGLYFTGHTLNLMTLAGLALVMGRLVDDPIVDIENTFRHLDMGKHPIRAALDSAREIALPVLVSTLAMVSVFFPVVFLHGMGSYLFQPLALSVAFAMFASYLLARTLSPAYCAYFLKKQDLHKKQFWLFRVFGAGYDKFRAGYTRSLQEAIRRRWLVLTGALALFLSSFTLLPFIGQELFPATDAGQILINVRAASGTRLEKTLELISGEIEEDGVKKKVQRSIEDVIMEVIPEHDRQMVVSDLGVLYDWPAGYTANAGPMDATIMIQLTDAHHRYTSSQEYASRLRQALAQEEDFQEVQFAFNTGGMVSAALSFGLPSPINIQIRGRNLQKQYEIAQELQELLQQVPNTADVRVQQTIDYPTIGLELDRKKMAELGISMEEAAKNVLSVLNSSTVFDSSSFWLDPVSGNHIFAGVTFREKDITWDNLMKTPITGKHGSAQQLRNLVHEVDWNKKTPVEINHNDLARVIDIFVNVEGRDVGSVAADMERVLSGWGQRNNTEGTISSWSVPDADNPGQALPGYAVEMRGEVSNMKESFQSLGFGFVLAAILVYLIMVAQFRSFLDPFIVMFAVPLGIIGVLAILFLTGTTLNIQSALGVIFMIGISVANSVLLVEFANRLRRERSLSALEAVIQASSIRLRPILMTSLAAILGLTPLALATGEAAAPLAIAVIGGLSVSTALTIFVVPCLYVILKGRQKNQTTPAASPSILER